MRSGPATVNLTIPGAGPALSSATLEVTVIDRPVSGYLELYPSGAARPVSSVIDFAAGLSASNTAIVPVGSTGAVSVYNGWEVASN